MVVSQDDIAAQLGVSRQAIDRQKPDPWSTVRYLAASLQPNGGSQREPLQYRLQRTTKIEALRWISAVAIS